MADQEHLNILKQGVEVWNKWRENNPEIEPDLQKAAIRGAHLREENHTLPNLYGADLSGVDLSGANLREADLSRTILVETDFTKANLTDSRVYGIGMLKIICKHAICYFSCILL